MAQLFIADNDDVKLPLNQQRPNKRGYRNVVDNLVLVPANYNQFSDYAHHEVRPEMLQNYAGYDDQKRPCVVSHQTSAGVDEPIDNTNCVITVDVDLRKTANMSKHHMVFPGWLPTDFTYLNNYVKAINEISSAEGIAEASKFLFGMMLLTRCR
jgi:hypothetical protein